MIESEVIREEMTSGDAGCTYTRFEEGVDGPWSDFRRACCRARAGIAGGMELTSIAA